MRWLVCWQMGPLRGVYAVLETEFAELLRDLTAETTAPPFAEIRKRRVRRTQRWAIVGAAVAAVVALAGTALAVRPASRSVPTPANTGTPSTTPSLAPSVAPSSTPSAAANPAVNPGQLVSLAATSSGTLYAVVARCVANCNATDSTQYRYRSTLTRSHNGGATWATVAQLPDLSPSAMQVWSSLYPVGANGLWLDNATDLAWSGDGGRTWRHWSLGAGDITEPDAVGGGVLWLARGANLYSATADRGPIKLPAPVNPPDVIQQVVATSADHAIVLAGNPDTSQYAWYETSDRGAHWARWADPCAGTPYPSGDRTSMAIAPDGALWVVCASEPGAGNQAKRLVLSTDGGRTWQQRGQLETGGYGTGVVAYSASVAWRTGGRADIFRTTDGRHWQDVAGPLDGFAVQFAPIDQDSAAYTDGTLIHVTYDGGKTWTSHPLPS